jgi:hypothetical protein
MRFDRGSKLPLVSVFSDSTVSDPQWVAAEYQHERLVRYYHYFGFKTVKTVGEDAFLDVPDRLVWGGVGTRMDGDVLDMLTRWSPVVLRSETMK